MQMIHNKPADQITERDHKLRRPSGADDRPDNFIIICLLIGYLLSAGQKFLDHIGKVFWKCFAHL